MIISCLPYVPGPGIVRVQTWTTPPLTHWESNPQPGYMHWLRMELATFRLPDSTLTNWAVSLGLDLYFRGKTLDCNGGNRETCSEAFRSDHEMAWISQGDGKWGSQDVFEGEVNRISWWIKSEMWKKESKPNDWRMALLFGMKKLGEVLDFRGKMGSSILDMMTLRHVVLSKGNVEYAVRHKSGIQGTCLDGNRPFALWSSLIIFNTI